MGHSGDGYDIELVRADKVPKNNKQRLKVLKVQIHNQSIHVLLLFTSYSHIYTNQNRLKTMVIVVISYFLSVDS